MKRAPGKEPRHDYRCVIGNERAGEESYGCDCGLQAMQAAIHALEEIVDQWHTDLESRTYAALAAARGEG